MILDPSIARFLGDKADEYKRRRDAIAAMPGPYWGEPYIVRVSKMEGSNRYDSNLTRKGILADALDAEFNLGEWRRQNPYRASA